MCLLAHVSYCKSVLHSANVKGHGLTFLGLDFTQNFKKYLIDIKGWLYYWIKNECIPCIFFSFFGWSKHMPTVL